MPSPTTTVADMEQADQELSIVSLTVASVGGERAEDEGLAPASSGRARPSRSGPGSGSTGAQATVSPGRIRRGLGNYFTAWVATMPDAVSLTGMGYIVSSHYHRIRR